MFCIKGVLKYFAKFTGKHLYFIKKETVAQLLSCEFYEIFKNNFFYGTPVVAASEGLSFYKFPRVENLDHKNKT